MIERYLLGETESHGQSSREQSTPEERQLVEERMAREPEFADLVEVLRNIDAVLADGDALDFAKELEKADGEYRKEVKADGTNEEGKDDAKGNAGTRKSKPNTKPNETLERDEESEPRKVGRPWTWQRWAVAASIILLAVVGGFFLLNNRGMDGPEAYNAYFTLYDAPANFRGDSGAIGPQYAAAFDAYNRKDWRGAVDGFQQILAADSTQVTAKFYQAIAQLANGDTDAAIQQFKELATGQHPFTTQSKWYWALGLLQKGDEATAEGILEELQGRGGKYGTLAGEVLERI
jgi:TolA-binding protein